MSLFKQAESKNAKLSKNVIVGLVFMLSAIYLLYYYTLSHSKAALGFTTFILVIDIVLYIVIDRLYNSGTLSINKVFIIILAFLGILFCFLFAPGTVPDEEYHFVISYIYSDMVLFQPFDGTGLTMRADDEQFFHMVEKTLERHDYFDALQSGFFMQDSSPVFVDREQTISFSANPLQLKIAPMLGVLLGRLLNLGFYPTFCLGRLFNLAFFIVLVAFAVRIMPLGKNIMRVAALLPMTLHVAASYSYDAGIIAFAFLLTALFLKAICGEGTISKRLCISIIIFAILLAPCKVIYTIIALTVFLIPSKRFSCKKNAYLFKLGVMAACVAAIVLVRLPDLIVLSGVEEEQIVNVGRGEPEPVYSLSSVLANPLYFIIVFLRTFIISSDTYIYTMLGGSLGWFQNELKAPWYLMLIVGIFLLASICTSKDDERVLKPSQRIGTAVICALGWLAAMFSMLLAFTPVTMDVIAGVQGRYFLPLLPLAMLAIRGKSFTCTRNLSWALVFGMLVINSVYAAQIFSIAMTI